MMGHVQDSRPLLVIAALGWSLASNAVGVPVTWEFSDGGNGHSYEAVAGSVTWSQANAAAIARGGYLATIQNGAENQFVFGLVDSNAYWKDFGDSRFFWGPWLGGRQPAGSAEPNGGWGWVTGEPFTYTNWYGSEPNNQTGFGDEDWLHYFSGPSGVRAPTWNDFFNTTTFPLNGFVVEYESECPVPGFESATLGDPNHYLPGNPIDTTALDAAVGLFRQKATAAGATKFQVTSGYRSTEQQEHLWEIKKKFQDLRGISDVFAYQVDIVGSQNTRPQLGFTQDPSITALACEECVTLVNAEINHHALVTNKDTGNPAVNPPFQSNHVGGKAVDISINGLTREQIRSLSDMAGLKWPYPDTDSVHFELKDAKTNLQGTFVAESPVNILVEAPDGRRIGFDPVSGEVVNDFGAFGEYSGAGSEPQVLVIPLGEVRAGEYKVTGVGTANGSYGLRAYVTGEDDASLHLADWDLGSGFAFSGTPITAVSVYLLVPEPSSLVLYGLGAFLFIARRPRSDKVEFRSFLPSSII